MKNNAVQNKNTILRVYCLSSAFELIFPAILKTVYSDKSNGNKLLQSTTTGQGTLPSLSVHYPWFNVICIAKERNAFKKFC